MHVDQIRNALHFRRTATACAESRRPVRVVEERHRAVLARDRQHLRERCDVAIHRVDAVEDDEHPPKLARRSRDRLFERGDVSVREHPCARVRELAAVDDRRVVEGVRDDHVALPGQRGDHADVRHVAGAEREGRLGTEECGELVLECLVQVEVPGDEPRAPGCTAELARRARGGLGHLRVVCEVEVVAARKEQDLAAVDDHARCLGAREDAHPAPRSARADRVERLACDLGDAHRGRAMSGFRIWPSPPVSRNSPGVASLCRESYSALPSMLKPASSIMR